jgi:phage FluMu protein Com
MPIIFTSTHTCEKCGKVFEWNHFELRRQNINSLEFIIEPMPHDITIAHNCHQRDIGVYDIEVNCPHCDFDNHFTFYTKKI